MAHVGQPSGGVGLQPCWSEWYSLSMVSTMLRPHIFLSVALLLPGTVASAAPKPPKSVRLYVFDCGSIKGLATSMFDLKPEEGTAKGFVVPCYLVVHPKGTLMWDVGVIPDSAFPTGGGPVTQGISTATRPLKA